MMSPINRVENNQTSQLSSVPISRSTTDHVGFLKSYAIIFETRVKQLRELSTSLKSINYLDKTFRFVKNKKFTPNYDKLGLTLTIEKNKLLYKNLLNFIDSLVKDENIEKEEFLKDKLYNYGKVIANGIDMEEIVGKLRRCYQQWNAEKSDYKDLTYNPFKCLSIQTNSCLLYTSDAADD